MDFHSYFSDNSPQNATTTCEHMKSSFNGWMKKFIQKVWYNI